VMVAVDTTGDTVHKAFANRKMVGAF